MEGSGAEMNPDSYKAACLFYAKALGRTLSDCQDRDVGFWIGHLKGFAEAWAAVNSYQELWVAVEEKYYQKVEELKPKEFSSPRQQSLWDQLALLNPSLKEIILEAGNKYDLFPKAPS